MKTYRLTINHDNGTFKIKTAASSKEQAINIVCEAENCPPGAIDKVERVLEYRHEKETVKQLKAIIKAHDALRNTDKTHYLGQYIDYEVLNKAAIQAAEALKEYAD